MLVWKKLDSTQSEDVWEEKLAYLGPMRSFIIRVPGRKSLGIEAYGLTQGEADALVAQFGGQTSEISDEPPAPFAPRKPLAIRDRFWVVESAEAAASLGDSRPALIIPAAMAFGTGEHATTASCLRLLCDIAQAHKKAGAQWDFIDLGTGSGILAIAAKKLGARHVEACDFDPHAVRTAKENVAINHAAPLPVRKTDVLKWTPPRAWDVVAANLFSQVLISAAPAIFAATRPGGALLLSGILRSQEQEVVAAFQSLGFMFQRAVHKGKWVTLLAERNCD